MVSLIVGQEIKALLDSLGTLGSITVGDMPSSPYEIGVIGEYGGRTPRKGFGVIGIQYERPAIQIVFRGLPDDYDTPMRKSRIAWNTLAAVQPGTISVGSAEYLTIDPQQSPFSLGKDINRCYEIACNFYIEKEP